MKITINDIEWEIVYVPLDSDLLLRSNGTQTIGVCDNNTQIIYIGDSLRGDLLEKVLCHEITHAAMFSYGVQLTVDQEELIADLIATYGEEIIETTNRIFSRIYKKGVA